MRNLQVTPKLAVWYTGHPICDTVAKSLAKGLHAKLYHVNELTDALIQSHDAHIAYGILRGTANVFKRARAHGVDWFNVDRGYFGAEHFNGTYRISHQSTQAKWTGKCSRMAFHGKALILPPTPDVCQFFNIDLAAWLTDAVRKAPDHIIRFKQHGQPIDWNVNRVITFNSSLGWEALQHGIACDSDSTYSIVGSFLLDGLPDDVHSDFEPLFDFMRRNQFTLAEIERGKASELIEHYLFS